jgi:hypothetical protein
VLGRAQPPAAYKISRSLDYWQVVAGRKQIYRTKSPNRQVTCGKPEEKVTAPIAMANRLSGLHISLPGLGTIVLRPSASTITLPPIQKVKVPLSSQKRFVVICIVLTSFIQHPSCHL